MKIKIFRRITQIMTILLVIAIPFLNRKGITLLMGSLYSLAIDSVWITDPLSGLQVILSTWSFDSVLLISMLIPIALALFLGKVFCSWMCPQNTVSEIFDYLFRRLKLKRVFKATPGKLPRYIILVMLVAIVFLLRFPIANLISAPGIISLQVTKLFYEGVVGAETGLIGIIVIAEVFLIRRLWCNYICPVGSSLGIFRTKKTMKVVYAEDPEHVCGRCLECLRACQLGLNPMEGKIYPLCHNCGDCIVACEAIKGKGRPLSFKF